jgi:CelD/BcsL family acetyltransferase involved in cellulose biosynthesis
MMTWTLLPAAEFGAHADRWAQFNDETSASPLLHVDFVRPLLAHFGTGKELLALCEHNGQLAAMAIVAPCGPGKWDTFQPSQAPIGMWMHRRGADLAALLGALTRALPGFPLVLGLTQRDPALDPLPGPAATLKSTDYIQTARIKIVGSFDDYWNARGKNLRANLKKQRAKLLKEGIATRLEVSRAPQDVAAAVDDYGRLESAGWKSGIGTAVSADNAQGRFYRDMLEGFFARGAGSILRYWFDDKIVAMNLCIEGRDCLIVLKTAYDESLGNQYSPAFLMREETCQQLFEEKKFDTLEFYGRVMEWHLRWTDDIRTMYHLTSYRWPALLQLHTLINKRAALLARLRPQLPAPLAAEQGKPSE